VANGEREEGFPWGQDKWVHIDSFLPPYFANSGSQRVYNMSGQLGVIKFNQDVTLNSLWLAGYGYNQYVEGYSNGAKVFESVHMPNNLGAFGTLLTLNWVFVDEIRIQSSDGSYNHYVLDDLTYTVPAALVPDAGSSAMLLSCALASLAAFRRKW